MKSGVTLKMVKAWTKDAIDPKNFDHPEVTSHEVRLSKLLMKVEEDRKKMNQLMEENRKLRRKVSYVGYEAMKLRVICRKISQTWTMRVIFGSEMDEFSSQFKSFLEVLRIENLE